MMQEWLHVSKYLGGAKQIFLGRANFLGGWLEVGGCHVENHLLNLKVHRLDQFFMKKSLS